MATLVNFSLLFQPDDEVYPLLMPRWGYVVSAFVLFIIGFFGFFLNLLVILLMFKDRQLWTPLNMILFNLVCSDFCVSLLGNPLTLISALFHHWVFGATMCMLYGFFMALLGITSITTLTVLSFERYMMVTRPLTSRHLSTRGACLTVLFIWTYSLALTTPPLFGWGSYVNEAANISCSVNWHEQSTNSLTYILFLFAMGQVVPMAIIVFSYVNIIRTIRRNSQRMGRVGRAESKVTVMVFVMIVAFTVAWTPYSVFALIEQFAKSGTISPGVGVIPALIAKSSICYDPLIYIGMNSQFRQAIRRLFGDHSRRGQSLTERGYDNTVLSPAVHRYPRATDTARSEANARRQLVLADNITIVDCKHEHDHLSDLQVIQERHTVSDTERSGDTICDEDSARTGEPPADKSPALESKNLLKKKNSRNQPNEDFDASDSYENVFCNRGYDKEPLDLTGALASVFKKRIQGIHQSYSMDVVRVHNEVAGCVRKLSAETKLDASSRSCFQEDPAGGKGGKGGKGTEPDHCRTFLCQVHMLQHQDDDDFGD